MFFHYVRFFIKRHIYLSTCSYSNPINKPLNIAFFGSDLFSMRILEHLYDLFNEENSRIKNLEVVTSVSSSNAVMKRAAQLELTIHTWPYMDLLISKSPVQFDLGILASFGPLLPERLITSFPL